MDRIGPAGGSPTIALTDGAQGFVDENLASGQEGTLVPAAFMNALQEELMSVLAAGGIAPNIAVFNQVLSAINVIAGRGIQAYAVNGSYTWVAPPGWYSCNLMMIGAGGGGGAGGSGGAGSGGSSGGLAWGTLAVTPGSSWSVYVGAGGAGGVNGGAAAQPGGSTGLGGVYATGGGPGTAGAPGMSVNSVIGGQGYGGLVNLKGSPGGAGITLSGGYLMGGAGASAPFTGGGPPSTFGNGSTASAGFVAQAPGAGGSGACLNLNGGAGADGLVLIWR